MMLPEKIMIKTNSTKTALFFRVVAFVAIHVATFAAILQFEPLQEFQLAILLVPLVSYLALFLAEAKYRIHKGLNYDGVWRGCFWFSFWAGASLTLPFIIFRVGPDGPIKLQDLRISYLLAYPIGCAVFGGLAGLVGTVLINQFYGVLGGNKNRHVGNDNS
jgi:hypothetical protein